MEWGQGVSNIEAKLLQSFRNRDFGIIEEEFPGANGY
jgi:hypothetical protein